MVSFPSLELTLYLYLIIFENEIEKLDMIKISLVITSGDKTGYEFNVRMFLPLKAIFQLQVFDLS